MLGIGALGLGWLEQLGAWQVAPWGRLEAQVDGEEGLGLAELPRGGVFRSWRSEAWGGRRAVQSGKVSPEAPRAHLSAKVAPKCEGQCPCCCPPLFAVGQAEAGLALTHGVLVWRSQQPQGMPLLGPQPPEV